MKAKLCSNSQRWTLWFTSNTQGRVCTFLPGTRVCSPSRQDYCVPLSTTLSRGPTCAFTVVVGSGHRMAGSPEHGPFRCFTRGLCCLRRSAHSTLTPICSGGGREGGMSCKTPGEDANVCTERSVSEELTSEMPHLHAWTLKKRATPLENCLCRLACFCSRTFLFLFFSQRKLPIFIFF